MRKDKGGGVTFANLFIVPQKNNKKHKKRKDKIKTKRQQSVDNTETEETKKAFLTLQKRYILRNVKASVPPLPLEREAFQACYPLKNAHK